MSVSNIWELIQSSDETYNKKFPAFREKCNLVHKFQQKKKFFFKYMKFIVMKLT